MVKSTNTKWFTLVELIIVITILAILATIAFISFQGYSKEARNSKRASDLNSIVRAIEIKTGADGVEIMNFAANSNAALTTVNLGGRTGVVSGDTYQAGDINFTVLGNVDNTSFKDPQEGNYKIWVTSLAGGAYQLAAIQENEGGKAAYVVGTYKARTTTDTASGTVSGNVLTLETGIGLFKKWDILLGGAEVISISSDLTRITVNSGALVTNPATTQLAVNESAWLVAAKGTPTVAVENGSWATLPY